MLALNRRGNALELRAVGVSVKDDTGRELSRADARIELAVLPLLIGRVTLVRADFDGADITFTRKRDGAMEIAFGPEGSPPDVVIPASTENEPLEVKVARMAGWLGSGVPLGRSRRGPARGEPARGHARYYRRTKRRTLDRRLLRMCSWRAKAAHLRWSWRRGWKGPMGPRRRRCASPPIRASNPPWSSSAPTNVRPRALFSEAALGPFAALDAPLTATVSLGLDRRVGISRLEGEASLGRGAAIIADERFSLDGGSMRGRYDIESDELILDQLALGGATTRINGEVRVRDVSAILRSAPDAPAAFNITFPSMRVDVPGTFAQPIDLGGVEVAGAIVSADRSINFTRLHARIGEATLDATGRVYWAEAGADRRVHPGIALQAAMTGVLDARAGINFWPVGMGEGARSYVARTLLDGGRVSDVRATIDVRPADVAAGVLRNEAVDMRFNFSGAGMRFIDTMSPVTDARGSGVLRGNSFELTIDGARMNNLAIGNGRIEAPRLRPAGSMLTVSARADGDARNLVEVLMQEPIAMGDRLPVTPASVTGRGVVSLRLQRPIRRDVTWDDWRFSIDGADSRFRRPDVDPPRGADQWAAQCARRSARHRRVRTGARGRVQRECELDRAAARRARACVVALCHFRRL